MTRHLDGERTDLTVWLESANQKLLRSTELSIDVEATLVALKERADAEIAEMVGGVCVGAGALALKPLRRPAPRHAEIIAFPRPRPVETAPDGLRAAVEFYLTKVQRGDRAALEPLLDTIRPFIVRYARSRLGRTEGSFAAADDVAQEICLGVLKALPDYRNEGRTFLAFVYGIAAHKVAHARVGAEPMVPEPRIGDAEPVVQDLAVCLNELPDRQREVLVLRVVVGLTAEETAEALGSSPGAVRVAQHRALCRLRGAVAQRE